MTYSITRFGKPLDPSKYTIDEKNKVFCSNESYLVIAFIPDWGWTFKTGSDCVFATAGGCTFTTGDNCTFNTAGRCRFTTGSKCTFDTGDQCIFKTGSQCTFATLDRCGFTTGSKCTFATLDRCIFKTGKECAVVRRDVYEVIEIPVNTKIKLNEFWVTGYAVIKDKPITIEVPTNANVNINGKVYSTNEILSKLGE